jgi:hypothetical protein
MRYLRCLLFLTIASLPLFAQESFIQDSSAHDQELNERDFIALREYLNTKREDIASKKNNLAISGDVRFEWRHLNKRLEGVNVRGKHRKDPEINIPISMNDFDSEFNLKFDYVVDRSWAVAHLQYDNSAGVDSQAHGCDEDPHGWFGSGTSKNLNLRKAYMGYNIYLEPSDRLDIELGRRGNLYHVFDSRVQFLSRFDGVLVKWSANFKPKSEWYVKLGGLVVDERVNHFAYVMETGWLDVCDSGFDLKYSFIDWCNHVDSRCIKADDPDCRFKYLKAHHPTAYDYAVSQWTLVYHLDKHFDCYFKKRSKLYAAFLMNHKRKHVTTYKTKVKDDVLVFAKDADGNRIATGRYRANLAWYVGLLIGEVEKEGDWAFEIQYQVVQAVAVPGQDMAGIGTGNVLDYTLTMPQQLDNTNYRGWKVEGLYALTDNITVDAILEASWADNPHIGGNQPYSKVEVEAIYAF